MTNHLKENDYLWKMLKKGSRKSKPLGSTWSVNILIIQLKFYKIPDRFRNALFCMTNSLKPRCPNLFPWEDKTETYDGTQAKSKNLWCWDVYDLQMFYYFARNIFWYFLNVFSLACQGFGRIPSALNWWTSGTKYNPAHLL